MNDCALLIIDMQNDFIRDGSAMQVPGAGRVIPEIVQVLSLFRRHGLPVFHVVRIQRADGSDVEVFRKDAFRKTPYAVEGTEGAGIIAELTPAPGEYIIRKNRMSAFMHTDLDLLLRSLGIVTVYITGVQTPNCIRTTVFDAAALNYSVVLVEDAVAARNENIHRANLEDMVNIGVRIVKTSEVGALLPR